MYGRQRGGHMKGREDITDKSDIIKGVFVKKLKVIPDDRGFLMEMIRNDDPFWKNKFGQVYMTVCKPGYVKGWHYHNLQDDHFVVIKGTGRVLLYDNRKDSPTKGNYLEFIMGENNPLCVVIPKGVLHGIECNEDEECYLVNTVTEAYNYSNPDEFRVDPFDNDIPIKWNSTKGG